MRRLWPLVLLLLLLLPGLPPLLRAGLVYGAERAGFRLEVGRVRGYALFGLELKDVKLRGQGLALEAGRLRLDYQLLGLLGGRLPIRVALSDAEVALDWRTLFSEGGGGGGAPPVRPVLTGLELERVRVRLGEDEAWSLPPLTATVAGRGPYRVRVSLPGGEVHGELALRAVPEFRFRAPLKALAYWYPEIEAGELSGRVRFLKEGISGEGRVEGGRLSVVGFPLEDVGGEVRLFPDRLEAELSGRGLEGPVRARAEVNWGREQYRFSVEAEPTWRAVARHFGAALPLEGRGRLTLRGEGWEALELSGRFSGTPRLLGYALPTRGELSYDGVFRLSAESRGRFYDREVALRFALLGADWRLGYRDDRGGAFALAGQGPKARGKGALPLPRPLVGVARAEAEIEGARWRVRVEAPGVRLLGFKPFSLSGTLSGRGDAVSGRLGPVAVRGRWSDLALRLEPLSMAVGSLSGELFYRGRFSGRLAYASPYTAFPIQVEEEGGRWRFVSPYGEGRYADGVFVLELASLPLRLGEVAVVSGRAVYREGGWKGAFEATSPHLSARAELAGQEAAVEARLSGPFGPLSLSGRYAEGELALHGPGFTLGYREGRAYYRGRLAYGPLRLSGVLAYDGRFEGELAFASGKLLGRLYAREGALWLSSKGPLAVAGRVWPDPELAGRFLGLELRGLRLLPLDLALKGSRLRLGEGSLDFEARRLDLRLPFELWGRPGTLAALGGFEAGRLLLSVPDLGLWLEGVGPWRALGVSGALRPLRLSLEGRLDLFALAYRLRGRVAGVEGELELTGRGSRYRLVGNLRSGGRLAFEAEPGGARLRAEGFSLGPWGLDARLRGEAGFGGGEPWADLRLRSGAFRAELKGRGALSLFLEGPGVSGRGRLGLSEGEATIALRHPWARGEVRLSYGPGGIEARGGGELRLPGAEPAPWRFRLEGARWALEGPVALSGEGARFRGRVELATALGPLTGRLEGEGLRAAFRGALELPAGEARLWGKLSGRDYVLEAELPGGRVRLLPGRLEVPGLDLGALGRALGVRVGGRVAGALGDGRGIAGTLEVAGEEARFALRRGRGVVWLSRLGGGVWVSYREGLRLVGLGALSGRLELEEGRWRGAMALRGPLAARVEVAGPAAAPRWRLGAEAAGLRLALKGEGAAYQGALTLDHPFAEGRLFLSGKGLAYAGEGELRTRRLLVQSGPVVLEGRGAQVFAEWRAPITVRYREGRLSVEGEAPLEPGGRVAGRLGYAPGEGFYGAMRLRAGPLEAELEGRGELLARIRHPGGSARLALTPALALKGEGEARARALKSELSLRYRVGGRLLDPVLEGSGTLAGEGAKLKLAFGYRRGPWARLSGPGAWVRLSGRFLEAEVERMALGPFLGLPLSLTARGAGEVGRLVLPLRLEGPGLDLAGAVESGGPRLSLRGALFGGRAELVATPEEARLSLKTERPEVRGALRWRRGEGLRGGLDLRLSLPGGALVGRLSGRDLALSLSGEGALSGELRLFLAERRAQGALRYALGGAGAVRAVAEGGRIRLRGEGGLAPLEGGLDLARPALWWRYQGPLPGGAGTLAAGGRLPGRWLRGRLVLLGQEIALLGEGGALLARGPGLSASLRGSRIEVELADFALGPLVLSGRLEGSPRALSGGLSWRLGRYRGEARIACGEELRVALKGDLAGALSLGAGGWSGELAGPFGELRLLAPYRAEGRFLGEPLALDLAAREGRLGGLSVAYPWRFSGEVRLGGVRVWGEGARLFASAFGFRLEARPSPLVLRLTHARGQGALVYREGKASGSLEVAGLRFSGQGREVRFSGTTPAVPALPLPAGEVEGRVGLDGAWRLGARAGAFVLEGEGRGADGVLRLKSPYGGGTVRLAEGLRGELSLRDLPFFGFALDLDFRGPSLGFTLKGAAGTVEGSARFEGYRLAEAGAQALAFDLARLPLAKARLPHLVGRVGAVLRYRDGEGFLQVGSSALGAPGAAYPFALTLRFRERVSGELVWAGLRAGFSWNGGLRVSGEASDFPLELPAEILVGPIEGGVRFTGRFAGGGPEPWLELVGERVRVETGTGRMVGEVALRFREGTLELLRLALEGDGRIEGAGRWAFGRGGDFWLRVEGADFTPLLRLDPRLARYRPTGRGDLAIEGRGQRLLARGQGAFEIAGVGGRVGALELDYDAGQGRFELSIAGRVERPVASAFRLRGAGEPGRFTLAAEGSLEAPLLAPLEGVRARLRYPEMELEATAGAARLAGRLWPLDLRLVGRLPIAYPRYYLISGEAEADLRLRLEEDGLYHLSGEAEVLKALLALPKKRPVVEAKKRRELPIAFDRVRIHAAGGVVLNEPLAQGELAGQVFLGGTAGDPFLAGEVRALRGSFLLLNHRFEVEEAWARFSPELGIYPRVFLRARAETPKGPVLLFAEGHFERRGERAELVLETCLADLEVPDLAACKLLPQEGAAARLLGLDQGELAQQVLEAAVKNLLIGQLESELAKTLGLDLFRFETGAFEGEGIESTRFTLGKYLSPDLFLAYRYDFAEGSRVYARYQRDGLSVTFATDLSPEPNPEFSLGYAFSETLAAYLRLAEDRFELGLEWRP